ncbi:MAG: tRNA pseudouridine(55) synthase TruB, partial [Ruminococcus sp.]|nr:tRNA pseudouridine(55) synthase TruB [Ruminococcus sp.]
MNGILCVNKPQDFTSFDVVAKLRGILKMKRLGHGGTLDPMATGVLPVFVGNATKAVDIMPVTMKSYTADFRLGFTSDTQDVWGSVEKVSDRAVSLDEFEAVLPQF